MNSFGLGLVLNFTDNASAGMRNATSTFQQMSSTADAVSTSVGNSMTNMVSACYALDSVGNTLVDIGSSVVGTFFNISQEVIDTGMTMMGFRSQLRALYGEDAFEDKMKQIQLYAKDSVFEVEGLMSAVVTMKSVGIEAMNSVTSSSGKTTQTLMDYASDIAAMFPNMRNAYGTGVNAAMGALKEYIAEGNALSLKRGAGLDITGLLGEDKGKSIKERTKQVADLVEVLGIAGYTTSLLGTPTQQLSKMQDILFNAMSDISDSGVFERYTQLLTKAATWLDSLVGDTDKYNAIIAILGDTITSVITPLESFLDLLITGVDKLLDWAVANPELAKNILITVAAVGAFLVAGGLFLKLVSSIGMASAGFNFLKSLPNILGTVGLGFTKLIFKATPFLALAGLIYYAWTQNLFGLRDVVTENFEYLKQVFSLIGNAWKDNTLTKEDYDLANSMGILPLIEAILQAKYYWDFFVEGFKKGFEDFFKSIEEVAGVLGFDLSDAFVRIGEFLKSLFDIGQEGQWTAIGENAGKIAGIAISLLAIVKVLSFLKPLFNLFGGKGGLFGGIFGGKGAGGASSLSTMKDMGIMLIGLSGVLAVVGLVSKIPFSIPRVIQLSIVIGLLGVVGAVVTKVSSTVGNIPVTTVSKGLANIAIIMTGLSAVLAIVGLVSMIPFDIPRVIQVIAVIGIIGLLGAALSGVSALISLIPVTAVALGLANIAIIMGGLTGLFYIIGLASSVANPVDVLAVIAVITVLGVVGTVLAGFAALIGLVPIPIVLAGIANIGLVVGALTGLALLISEALPTIGDNLNTFILTMQPAFDVLSSLRGLDMAGIGSFFTSLGEFMLQVTGDKFLGFFTGGSGLIDAANELVDFATTSKVAFDTFAQMPVGSVAGVVTALTSFALINGLDFSNLPIIGENFVAFTTSLRESFSNLPNIEGTMISSLNSCTSKSLSILNSFASKGSKIGNSLMNSIASGISARASAVSTALKNALNSINITATPKITLNLEITPSVSTAGMIGLATGGYVKDTGVAVLHPNEVVVNDDTTRKLNEFLNQQNTGASGSPSYSSSKGETHNDYSVTFSAGSIVIQLSNASDSELEKAAEKLMKIIERKQQLKAMASRA